MPERDYMSMAQGAAPMGAEPSPEELAMTDQDYAEAGLPGGEGPEAMKQRVMSLLEQMGALEGLDQAELQELNQLADQLVADLEAENFEAVEQNPLMQILGAVFEEMMGPEGQGQAPMDPAAMAGGGMPPMPGGGM